MDGKNSLMFLLLKKFNFFAKLFKQELLDIIINRLKEVKMAKKKAAKKKKKR